MVTRADIMSNDWITSAINKISGAMLKTNIGVIYKDAINLHLL